MMLRNIQTEVPPLESTISLQPFEKKVFRCIPILYATFGNDLSSAARNQAFSRFDLPQEPFEVACTRMLFVNSHGSYGSIIPQLKESRLKAGIPRREHHQ